MRKKQVDYHRNYKNILIALNPKKEADVIAIFESIPRLKKKEFVVMLIRKHYKDLSELIEQLDF